MSGGCGSAPEDRSLTDDQTQQLIKLFTYQDKILERMQVRLEDQIKILGHMQTSLKTVPAPKPGMISRIGNIIKAVAGRPVSDANAPPDQRMRQQ